MNVPTRFWHRLEDGRVQCDVCPRGCRLREGQRGFCHVRACAEREVVLTAWGNPRGLCVDPIEKKPLHHFLPGTAVLSFGTVGCNLDCRYCQNWELSRGRGAKGLACEGTPEAIAREAERLGCRSVAFTYNDPVVFLEYAVDVARASRARGLRSVAVSAGYVEPAARRELFGSVDAANVDLKSLREAFYAELAGGHLQPVLDTLRWLVHESDTWVEITTLLVPGRNDSDAEIAAIAGWIASELHSDVPLHLTALHPAGRMLDVPPTPPETLSRARGIARRAGLHHVYTGNVLDREGGETRCHACGELLVAREGFVLLTWRLAPDGRCPACAARCAGVFERCAGGWGGRRLPVELRG